MSSGVSHSGERRPVDETLLSLVVNISDRGAREGRFSGGDIGSSFLSVGIGVRVGSSDCTVISILVEPKRGTEFTYHFGSSRSGSRFLFVKTG